MNIDISLIFGDASRWIMPVLALLVAAFCVPSLLKGNKKIGVTGYLVNEANGVPYDVFWQLQMKCRSGAARRAISSSDITPFRVFTPCFQSIRTAGV